MTEEFVPEIAFNDYEDKKRINVLKSKFFEIFSSNPEYYCRAPGRVNLIGEHIDYCGYGVLPMAIDQDILIAASRNDSNKLKLYNLNDKYGAHEVECSSFEIDKTSPKWYHYFLCGYKGIMEKLSTEKEFESFGLNVLVYGSVPPCAGLSSSSALVCASSLATMLPSGCKFTKLEMAELCQHCEKYIGTEGGGMDQSISFLAQKGKAKYVEFNPIRGTDVQIPAGGSFVIANSCVEMNKAATDHFNIRVAECRLTAQYLAFGVDLNWRDVKRLVDVQNLLNISLEKCLKLVDRHFHIAEYSKEEICARLRVTEEELDEISLGPRSRHVRTFKLRQRAKHVYSEALRVLNFKDICNKFSSLSPGNGNTKDAEGDVQINASVTLKQLGELMNASHKSCRDDYECSCKELDDLVHHSICSGALGSRLTGAGWGGCCVSLVEDEKLDEFMLKMRNYYKQKGFSDAAIDMSLFVSNPGQGAAIILDK